MRAALRISLLCAGATLLALLLVELAARLFLDSPVVNSSMIADVDLGYRLPPEVELISHDRLGPFPYRLNSEGFRGPELSPADAAPAGGERILLIGDSFLNAWGVRDEEWVGTVLERELLARGVHADVRALCADDFGTAQELILLKRYGRRARPTTVVLLLYPPNDLINNCLQLAGRTNMSAGDYFRPYLVPQAEGGFALQHALPWQACLRHSRLFTLLESRWLKGRDASELRERLALRHSLPGAARADPSIEHLQLFQPGTPGDAWDHAWHQTLALVRAHAEEAGKLGARFLVCVVPYLMQVEDAVFTYLYREHLGARGDQLLGALDWNSPETRLEGFFHAQGIDHLQLLTSLREAMARERRSPYLIDGHLDGRGHALMGSRIAECLLEAGETGCFRAGEHEARVDLGQLFGAQPLRLDFLTHEHRELIGNGWAHWRAAGAEESGGWVIGTPGSPSTLLFPTRRGSVTVEGRVTHSSRFPITVRLHSRRRKQGVLDEQTLEQPGSFALRVPGQSLEGLERAWELVSLVVEPAQSPDSSAPQVTAFLTALSSEL